MSASTAQWVCLALGFAWLVMDLCGAKGSPAIACSSVFFAAVFVIGAQR